MSKVTIRAADEHPKIVRRVNLRKYHPDLKSDFIEVWVNIDRALSRGLQSGRWKALQIAQMPAKTDEDMDARQTALDALVNEMKDLHCRWWGCTRDEVDYLYEVDTGLYHWLVDQANEAQEEYDEERKNAGRESSDS